MKTADIFARNPLAAKLTNEGQARIVEQLTDSDYAALHDELSMFVCEGHYANGLETILESYLNGLNNNSQRAAWVSGFFGSGKSHLLKMLQHLWVNTEFPAQNIHARKLVRNMPDSLSGLLKELDTQGRRHGGLFAAAGSLGEGTHEYPRRTVIEVVLRAAGLPPHYTQGRFALWLRREGKLDALKKVVVAEGANFDEEVKDFQVSTIIARALLKALPGFADDEKGVRQALRSQYNVPVADISTPEFTSMIKEILTVNGKMPCTVIILDEVQQYIGQNSNLVLAIQEVAESLNKGFEGRVLLVASGQSGLTADAVLQKLKDRFPISIGLQDADVSTVTRKVLLQKKPAALASVEKIIADHAGEISQQLQNTKIAERGEDKDVIVEDFPLLPVRRRFWEEVLRGVDRLGLHSQLRAQLRIIYDALKKVADKPLGHVIRADYIFDHLRGDLVGTNQVLPREIHDRIMRLDDGSPDGVLKRRICGLIFLLHKVARQEGFDVGLRATPRMLADLLVEDLANDGPILREKVPKLLASLEKDGHVLKLGEEYSIQTREGLDWEREFGQRTGQLKNDDATIGAERDRMLRGELSAQLNKLTVKQGQTETRKPLLVIGSEPPGSDTGRDIPVWIRDEWDTTKKEVLAAARNAGADSGTVFVFIAKSQADELKQAIIEYNAARQTLEVRGAPTTTEGQEARQGMLSRRDAADAERTRIIRDMVDKAQVFLGGGREQNELTLEAKVKAAGESAVTRLFPEFHKADQPNWTRVIDRAKKGDGNPLEAINWKESPEKHPVCKAVLAETTTGAVGRDILKKFEAAPYGWPQDAVFGALIALTRTGHVRAVKDGKVTPVELLDQTACKVNEFRAENITLTTGDKLKLVSLFQTVGIHCQPGQLSENARPYLERLRNLADAAGGEPPLPANPDTSHLDALMSQAGNEQLAAILARNDTLKQQAEAWKALAELAERRQPAWQRLQALCRHGEGLPEVAAIQPDLKAIVENRMLLQANDPVAGLLTTVESVLRRHLKTAVDACRKAYTTQLDRVKGTDAWEKLGGPDREDILGQAGLAEPTSPRIETTEELLRVLELEPLAHWSTRADAFSAQAGKAIALANKKLEPQTQFVRVSGATLKNESDVKTWIAATEKSLLGKIKDGPIVIE